MRSHCAVLGIGEFSLRFWSCQKSIRFTRLTAFIKLRVAPRLPHVMEALVLRVFPCCPERESGKGAGPDRTDLCACGIPYESDFTGTVWELHRLAR